MHLTYLHYLKINNWFWVLFHTLSFFRHGSPQNNMTIHLFIHKRLKKGNQHISCHAPQYFCWVGLINPCLCLGHFNSCLILSLTHDLLLSVTPFARFINVTVLYLIPILYTRQQDSKFIVYELLLWKITSMQSDCPSAFIANKFIYLFFCRGWYEVIG